MMVETTTKRIHNTPELKAAEYMFALSMGCELMLKVFDALFFVFVLSTFTSGMSMVFF